MTDTDSEICGVDDRVDAEATASNFADMPTVDRCTVVLPGAVNLNQDACWFDKPHGSICRLAAPALLFMMVATTTASLDKRLIASN
ncbi:hypothetical protein [Bradyrhizobium cenepequi]|uniref:hypothetical protein n=1 Tax=Bradyrhizobium cenepequi TaxID=2821403 RepID=UPI001CE268EA|nr:hypothetical protein [Bradyrhizobium cenepequi]MCA6107178.1 hypothetical protein [Bradyrhizobium cenepequi]